MKNNIDLCYWFNESALSKEQPDSWKIRKTCFLIFSSLPDNCFCRTTENHIEWAKFWHLILNCQENHQHVLMYLYLCLSPSPHHHIFLCSALWSICSIPDFEHWCGWNLRRILDRFSTSLLHIWITLRYNIILHQNIYLS